MDDKLIGYVRQAYGWDAEVAISAGPRGALGQIWRLEAGPVSYALKEIFYEPPSDALIAAELAFAPRAASAGVRLPASHPDRDGRYLLTAPDGTWLRLYDWVDLRPVDVTAQATPGELGALLAALHRCAPATAVEPGGGPPDPWHERLPAFDELARVAESDVAWAARLADRLPALAELGAAVAPSDPAAMILCHRDLHPENVLADPSGALVVVDWDNLGPCDPSRELARALFDWFCEDPLFNLDAMQAMHEAYLRAGGPGRLTEPADFSMLIATRLNYLLVQARVALDPEAEPRHRDWAEREIEESLRILPTSHQLTRTLNRLSSRSAGR